MIFLLSPEAVAAKRDLQYYVPSRLNFSKQHLGCVSMIAAISCLRLWEKNCSIKILKQPRPSIFQSTV